MKAWAAIWLVGLVSLATLASAQAPLEIDVLEGYLEQHDSVPELPHCARHDGTVITPTGPTTIPGGATNDILRQHKDWHLNVEGPPGSQGDPDDSNRFGDYFVFWHRDFINEYEVWRVSNGHPTLPAWDPSTPIASNLAYEFPGRGCTQGRNSDPGVPLPTWATLEGGSQEAPLFGHTSLCEFQDINQFGKAIAREYHPEVHRSLGGDMSGGQGPRDPIFWSYHRFLDDLSLNFELNCSEPVTIDPASPPPSKDAASVGILPAIIAAAALVSRRRGLLLDT